MENENRGRLLEESMRAKKEERGTITLIEIPLLLLYFPFYIMSGLIRSIPGTLFWLWRSINFILTAGLCGMVLGLNRLFCGTGKELSRRQGKAILFIAAVILSAVILVFFIYMFGWLWGTLACLVFNSLVKTGAMLHQRKTLWKTMEQNSSLENEQSLKHD